MHRHRWTPAPGGRLGFYAERGEPTRWFSGRLLECACGALLFSPDGALPPVEVERVELDEGLRKSMPGGRRPHDQRN